MRHSSLSNTVLFLLYVIGTLAGDVNDMSLVGCDWFDESDPNGCTHSEPPEPHDRCHFEGSWASLGMKRVETTKDENSLPHLPSDLMFTQAMKPDQVSNKLIYIYTNWLASWSAPVDGVKREPSQSCALVLNQREPKLRFPGWDEDPASATGTCADALDQPCMDAMMAKSKSLVNVTSDGINPCWDVVNAFTEVQKNRQLLPECATGRNADLDFGDIQLRSFSYNEYLSGENLMPEFRQQDSCYPSFLPREHSGMYRMEIDVASQDPLWPNSTREDFLDKAFAITPILMISWNSQNGSFHSASSMTCMKPVDTNGSVESLVWMYDKRGDGSSGGPAALSAPVLLTLALGLILSVAHVYCFD